VGRAAPCTPIYRRPDSDDVFRALVLKVFATEVKKLPLKARSVKMALRLIIQWKRKKWYQNQEQWIDTNWMDVENARRYFPKFTYREIWVRCE
jgi:hypothetical protein